jgi:hypothetical protein
MLIRHLRLQRAELPIGHALAITSAMCAGLHCAHEAQDLNGEPLQIVHRDVRRSRSHSTAPSHVAREPVRPGRRARESSALIVS